MSQYFEVQDSRLKAILDKMGRKIRRMLPDNLQFTVFIFSDDPRAAFYISSVERNSGVDFIEEWVHKEKARQQGRMN